MSMMETDLSRIKKLSDHRIAVVLAVILLLSGGFYDYSAMVLGALLSLEAVFALRGRNVIRHYISIPVIFILWQLPVSIWAIDRYQALAGFLRFFPLVIWMWLCSQHGLIDRGKTMAFIPYSGAVMTLAGLAAYITGIFKERLWMADRFGGTFQYANTCALYLLLGIILLTELLIHSDTGKRLSVNHIVLIVLIFGLLLTGSRSILIIAILWGIYKSVRTKSIRFPFIIAVGVSAIIGGLYAYITGNLQNIGRIFTSFSYGSTFFGRLLYMKDAVKIILKFPQGLGYRGYYYVQPLYQNGVYDVRFVHNDYLQAALDVGLVPALLLITWLAVMIIKGRTVREYRELLAVILISAFFDLHMQYELILMIAILCFDLSGDLKGNILTGGSFGKYTNMQRTEDKVIFALAAAVFMVFTIPFAAYRTGNYELMLGFFPHDTEAEIGILAVAEDADYARKVAMDVTDHNPYVPDAYRHLAFTAMMNGDHEEVLDNMDEVIRLGRYNLKDYALYDTILDGIQSAILSGQAVSDMGKQDEILRRVEDTKQELPHRLEELKETTDPLAYKLRDVPKFSWE